MPITKHPMRTLFALAIVAASLALTAPTPASAASTTITLEGPQQQPALTYEPIVFTGKVTPADATTRVVLQVKVTAGWSDVAGVRPWSDGSYELAWNTLERGTYTMRARSLHGSVVTEPVDVVVKPHPTVISAYPYTRGRPVVVGQRIEVRGSVIERNATPRVVVQRKVDGKWSDRNAGIVDSSGQFSIIIVPSQVGRYDLRVRSANGTRWTLYPMAFDVAPKPVASPAR